MEDSAKKPIVIIYRTRLLPFSETFIREQAEAMRTFRPFFVGVKRVPGLDLPSDSLWVTNRGGLAGLSRELLFRVRGLDGSSVPPLRALAPRLIHAHFGHDACEAIPLSAALDIPLIATFHGYDATLTDAGLRQTWQGRRYLRRRPRLPAKASLFLAVSDFIRTKMEAQGFPPERTLIHYIGVDTEEFKPAPNEARKQQVLFVARLVEKKGCAFLIKAMAEVQSAMPEVELIVIGDGPQKKKLEDQARRSLQRFRFLGKQSPSVVKQWMQQATVFSVPSITAANGDAEGFGIVFAEAQSSGLPVVSFASGGISEAVAHEETGFLAPERDWRKLSEYLLLLLGNDALRQRFSRAGRRRIQQRFDLRKQTAVLEDIYEGVISSRSAGIGQAAYPQMTA